MTFRTCLLHSISAVAGTTVLALLPFTARPAQAATPLATPPATPPIQFTDSCPPPAVQGLPTYNMGGEC